MSQLEVLWVPPTLRTHGPLWRNHVVINY